MSGRNYMGTYMSSLESTSSPLQLEDCETPCLLLDEPRMARNIERLQRRLQGLGTPLRPHLKTAKCLPVARRLMSGNHGPAAVSTLREADYFGKAGVRDILYAVGIAPAKLERVVALRRNGIDLSIVLDSVAQAQAVASKCRESGDAIPVLIEVDSDGDRSGVRPDDPLLVDIGRILVEGGAELRGVMTHAGGSYECDNAEALVQAAENERFAAVQSATTLRAAGMPCPVVSVGSTPTAHFARDLTGVTEVRAGVFPFFDLVMVGIGVCKIDDIALSVMATVIGHQASKGWTIVDAGWMAMSRDRGTAVQAVDRGYGVVCDLAGRPFEEVLLQEVSQEHGVLAARDSSKAMPCLPVGSKVRILPNHACATSAQHHQYLVLGPENQVIDSWPRISGW